MTTKPSNRTTEISRLTISLIECTASLTSRWVVAVMAVDPATGLGTTAESFVAGEKIAF
jgi:hypothetical protein